MTRRACLRILMPIACVAVFAAAAEAAPDPSKAIRKADREFARALKDMDLDRFRDFLSEDALFFGGTVHSGRDAVARAWHVYFEPDAKSSLSWEPVRAEVAESGDLGFTVGNYTLRSLDEKGGVTVKQGAYVSIWRKEADGKWRAIVDIGTAPGSLPMEIPKD